PPARAPAAVDRTQGPPPHQDDLDRLALRRYLDQARRRSGHVDVPRPVAHVASGDTHDRPSKSTAKAGLGVLGAIRASARRGCSQAGQRVLAQRARASASEGRKPTPADVAGAMAGTAPGSTTVNSLPC